MGLVLSICAVGGPSTVGFRGIYRLNIRSRGGQQLANKPCLPICPYPFELRACGEELRLRRPVELLHLSLLSYLGQHPVICGHHVRQSSRFFQPSNLKTLSLFSTTAAMRAFSPLMAASSEDRLQVIARYHLL